MKVTIVTPGQLGSNPRVVKEARALAKAGHDVQVIATQVAGFVEHRDQAVMRDADYAVRRLAFGGTFGWKFSRARQELARRIVGSGKNAFSVEYAISAMTPELIKQTGRYRADLYIAHYVAALPAAARAARRHGARYAFDAEDFHLGDLPDDECHASEKACIRSIESKYLPRAAFVTAASPLIADAYADTYGIGRPVPILNVFPKANGPALPSPCGTAKPGPSLYWFSQTIGPGRGLETALAAIGCARTGPHLYLRGTPAAGFRALLEELAWQLGIGERLHFLPPVEPDEMERAGAIYDIGLVGELAGTHNRQIALTNKIFSYLTSGLAVVASDIKAHRQCAPSLQGAVRLFESGDAESLARVLDDILSQESKLASMRQAAWSLGQTRFSWDEQEATLVELVRNSVVRRAGSNY